MPLQTTINWIPTAERLPEVGVDGRSEMCLYIYEGRASMGMYMPQREPYESVWTLGQFGRSASTVTHWAPMPTFSEANKNGDTREDAAATEAQTRPPE